MNIDSEFWKKKWLKNAIKIHSQGQL